MEVAITRATSPYIFPTTYVSLSPPRTPSQPFPSCFFTTAAYSTITGDSVNHAPTVVINEIQHPTLHFASLILAVVTNFEKPRIATSSKSYQPTSRGRASTSRSQRSVLQIQHDVASRGAAAPTHEAPDDVSPRQSLSPDNLHAASHALGPPARIRLPTCRARLDTAHTRHRRRVPMGDPQPRHGQGEHSHRAGTAATDRQ